MACRDCEFWKVSSRVDRKTWAAPMPCTAPIPDSLGYSDGKDNMHGDEGKDCPCFKPVAITEGGNG